MVESFSSSEVIPYIIGSLLTLALIKWLFSRVEDRRITSPSLYFSYSPDPEAVRELQSMFPNIPKPYIVRELDRADGNVSVTIDSLVLISADFPNSPTTSTNSLASPFIRNPKLAMEKHHQTSSEGDKKVVLTRKNWDSVDADTRQRVLLKKKMEMFMKARESFNNQTDNKS